MDFTDPRAQVWVDVLHSCLRQSERQYWCSFRMKKAINSSLGKKPPVFYRQETKWLLLQHGGGNSDSHTHSVRCSRGHSFNLGTTQVRKSWRWYPRSQLCLPALKLGTQLLGFPESKHMYIYFGEDV